ncbi:MAG: hypothetical protein MUO67_13240 [Anaerolineales bacterium]|nr:hypothetical protein [Anaerolineales bacterium]
MQRQAQHQTFAQNLGKQAVALLRWREFGRPSFGSSGVRLASRFFNAPP